MNRINLKIVFLIGLLFCVVLLPAAGRNLAVTGYVDNIGDAWVPGVRSLAPIIEGRTYLNGELLPAFVACDYELFGRVLPYYSAVELGCLPKGVIYDPDGEPFKFTERDKAAISVRTIFGWSHYEIRRYRNKLTITQR